MVDTRAVLVMTANDGSGLAAAACQLPFNARCCREALLRDEGGPECDAVREMLKAVHTIATSRLLDLPRMIVDFDHGRNGRICCGSDPAQCQILLCADQWQYGIHPVHFYFVFDDNYDLWLANNTRTPIELRSAHMTPHPMQQNEAYRLSPFDGETQLNLLLQDGLVLAFTLRIPNNNVDSNPEFRWRVDRFRLGALVGFTALAGLLQDSDAGTEGSVERSVAEAFNEVSQSISVAHISTLVDVEEHRRSLSALPSIASSCRGDGPRPLMRASHLPRLRALRSRGNVPLRSTGPPFDDLTDRATSFAVQNHPVRVPADRPRRSPGVRSGRLKPHRGQLPDLCENELINCPNPPQRGCRVNGKFACSTCFRWKHHHKGSNQSWRPLYHAVLNRGVAGLWSKDKFVNQITPENTCLNACQRRHGPSQWQFQEPLLQRDFDEQGNASFVNGDSSSSSLEPQDRADDMSVGESQRYNPSAKFIVQSDVEAATTGALVGHRADVTQTTAFCPSPSTTIAQSVAMSVDIATVDVLLESMLLDDLTCVVAGLSDMAGGVNNTSAPDPPDACCDVGTLPAGLEQSKDMLWSLTLPQVGTDSQRSELTEIHIAGDSTREDNLLEDGKYTTSSDDQPASAVAGYLIEEI